MIEVPTPDCVKELYPFVGHFPMGANDPCIATIFSVASEETELELIQRLLPTFDHEVTFVNPVIIGLSPVPYASNLMGNDVELPDFDTVIPP